MNFLRFYRPTLTVVLLIIGSALIANFSLNDFNWSIMDFVVMTLLLSFSGFSIQHISKIIKGKSRVFGILIISILFLLIWMEMAVGIFNSPIAGS